MPAAAAPGQVNADLCGPVLQERALQAWPTLQYGRSKGVDAVVLGRARSSPHTSATGGLSLVTTMHACPDQAGPRGAGYLGTYVCVESGEPLS